MDDGSESGARLEAGKADGRARLGLWLVLLGIALPVTLGAAFLWSARGAAILIDLSKLSKAFFCF